MHGIYSRGIHCTPNRGRSIKQYYCARIYSTAAVPLPHVTLCILYYTRVARKLFFCLFSRDRDRRRRWGFSRERFPFLRRYTYYAHNATYIRIMRVIVSRARAKRYYYVYIQIYVKIAGAACNQTLLFRFAAHGGRMHDVGERARRLSVNKTCKTVVYRNVRFDINSAFGRAPPQPPGTRRIHVEIINDLPARAGRARVLCSRGGGTLYE